MAKAGKRVKSGVQATGSTAKWEQALVSLPFEEDSWKPNVTFVVGSRPEDYTYINILGHTVNGGTRKLFTTITPETLYADVRELGNPKVKKSKDVPANYEVCEACKVYLDSGDEIPVPLLARLIKFKLMALKVSDQKRREAERKAAIEKEKAKLAEKAGKERSKSPKKGGKKTPEPQAAKEGSKLKKRGEDESESKFIDDEPEDGAQFYIIMYGFHNPHLFSQLEEVSVGVDAIVRFSCQDYSCFTVTESETTVEKDEKSLASEEAARLEKARLKKDLRRFWKDLLPLLQKNPDNSKLHEIARLDYEVKSLIVPNNMEDSEQKISFGSAMYEDIATMIYDLIDARRLYRTYLQQLKLVHIPIIGEPQLQDGVSTSSAPTPSAIPVPQTAPAPDTQTTEQAPTTTTDMRYYNDLMNTIPQESVSIPIVMHCMLEQVCATEEGRDPPSEQQPNVRGDGLNSDLFNYLSGIAFKLALTKEEHESLTEALELPAQPEDKIKQPLLMSLYDDIAIRTHHLKSFYGFNPEETEKSMLGFLPFDAFRQIPRPTSAVARERAARLQELIYFCTTANLHASEIDRAFKQFVFECMDLTSTDPNGFVVTRQIEGLEHTVIPWDDPYPFFKGMIPKQEKSSTPKVPMYTPTPERSGARSPAQDLTADSMRTSRFDLSKKFESSDSVSPSPSSASSKKGILRPSSRTQTPDPKSRSNSVYFESIKIEEEPDVIQIPPLVDDGTDGGETGAADEKSVEESMMEIVDTQKRNMDQWCFAEHFEPHILLQVMKKALYQLPYVETYAHKRDNSVLAVFHSPFSTELQLHVDWHTELHSNLGFRNYLENVSEGIADWLKEKEAEYQAQLLSNEVQRMRQEEEAVAKAVAKAKGREKSPQKSPTRSKSPKGRGSRSSSIERPSSGSSNPYVRQGSLKAWKEEQDRIKAEEEEKEKQKSDRKTRSPRKEEKKDEEGSVKEKRRPSSRGSTKSRMSVKDSSEAQGQDQNSDQAQVPDKFWPFSGYDMGNQLIHCSGITTTLFPSDGGQIRTERLDFVQGTTTVKTSVLKDGHVFTVHIVDPVEKLGEEEEEISEEKDKVEQPEKAELEKSEKEEKQDEEAMNKPEIVLPQKPSVSVFGSITAHLADGMMMSLSQFGSLGEAQDAKKPEPEPMASPPPTASPPPQPEKEKASPTKGRKDRSKERTASTPDPQPPEDEVLLPVKEEEKVPSQPFQQVFVTSPDGLNVCYLLESSVGIKPISPDDRRLIVKQSYPFKTGGQQPCESLRKKYALTEVSRVVTSEGTVVKTMVDGSVEVLYADGTISIHTGGWPAPSRAPSPQRESSARSQRQDPQEPEGQPKKGRSAGKHSNKSQPVEKPPEVTPPQAEETEQTKGTWVTTYPSGERISCCSDGTVEELRPVMISLASDPETRQSMATRDDHVVTVSYPDGTTIVEHSDGSRITTYYRESQVPVLSQDAEETGESPQYETKTIKFVKVECPAYATIEFNCSTSENLTIFGNGTSINVFPDGFYMVHHREGGRVEVDTEGSVIYYPRVKKHMEQLLPERELQYVMRHNADVICETVDPDGNVFNIKTNGDFTVLPANGEELASTDSIEGPDKPIQKKIEQYQQHAPRFFIIHSDGSGTELLRYQDVAEYLTTAEQSSATAVLKEPLQDYPGVTGITVLKPYLQGLSDQWLKKYDMESIIPHGIRNRDLTTLPPKEYKKPGPEFGTTTGQGLSIGSSSKLATRIPILKCPEILELRQLVQYKPVSLSLRETLQTGLHEYAEYVMKRNYISEAIKMQDPRSEEQKMLAADLHSLAMSQAKEQTQYAPADVKQIYEKATAPPVPSPPPTPQAKRTQADWERDQREMAEEIEGRAALRNKKVPPYFESELGKAFLLTQAKDMDEMMKELSEDPRRDGTEAVRADTSSMGYRETQSPTETRQPQSTLPYSERSGSPESPMIHPPIKTVADTPLSYSGVFSEIAATPSGLRPGNPTPAHATGQGSPAPVRPKNPTPAHAGKVVPDRPVNPTPKLAAGYADSPSEFSEHPYPRSEYPMIPEQPVEEEGTDMTPLGDLVLTRSLKVNVVGEPRQESVPLPSSIMGGRPGAVPNNRFKNVEDPVRRKINTSLVAGATMKGQTQLSHMRGLNLLPEEVDFGVLREGNTYIFTVYLKNTGIDTCRFKVEQPPPATGIRVIYKPGPVAAGMKVELNLEIYAIAVGVQGESGVGTISHNLQILTETDYLILPIRATVLTGYEYDHRSAASPRGGKSAGTRLVSTKPPSSTGIIRPRRELGLGASM